MKMDSARCKRAVLSILGFFLVSLVFAGQAPAQKMKTAFISEKTSARVLEDLVKKHGSKELPRIRGGVQQVASFWREEDGNQEAFVNFCKDQFISDSQILQGTFHRFESHLESIDGHLHEIDRDINWPLQVDVGPILPVDYIFAELSSTAHLQEDLFKTKVAFAALLNFPIYTMDEKLRLGPGWSREEWARARLAERFISRVPAEIMQKANLAVVRAEDYISNYNIFMHNLLAGGGERLFPEGLKLIMHWGLRDELKSQYNNSDGLRRQRMIVKVMERILRQEIPAVVINNPKVDWDPQTNLVYSSGSIVNSEREPDVRYRHLLNIFQTERLKDPYFPNLPTFIARVFEREREIPEPEVERLFVSVLTSPAVKSTARLIEKRLGRKLEPHDIWYNGFRDKKKHSEQELDKIVQRRYPKVEAFQKDLPNLLEKLGFSKETASYLSERIVVDPSRGAGHAMGAERREDKAHLRTRFGKDGMDYKGFNIAIHELGHNVEEVFSLNRIDHTLLRGVPNTAFTEAFAFVFQAKDLELLGLSDEDPGSEHLHALDTLWNAFEISGVALLDMKVWHWMYKHPNAGVAELKDAVLDLSREIWNTYYAPVMGCRDSILLAVYSHMVELGLYLPDYPLGHIIAFQIEQHLKKTHLGRDMERMCRLGRIAPDAWMKAAVGSPISVEPLLEAAEEALKVVK